nr:RHS repeat-associated core domain-containing protein [Dysgonomonas sp. PH5-37]
MVADASGEVVQKTDYFPFGQPIQVLSRDEGVHPYKFGDKEYDTMHGLNLYDFHARQYDPILGRFTSVDPHADSYYSISPYAYCGNNPLRFIDPTGMDIYFVNEDGKMILGLKNDDDFDTLYAWSGTGDSFGHILGVGIKMVKTTIYDRLLLPGLINNRYTSTGRVSSKGEGGNYATTKSATDAFNLFYFLAKYTNVEWGLNGYNMNNDASLSYVIFTSHKKIYVINTDGPFDFTKKVFDLHFHPKSNAQGASGYKKDADGSILYTKDMYYIREENRKYERYHQELPNYYVYNPQLNELYMYTPTNPQSKTYLNINTPKGLQNIILNKKRK